MNFGVSFTNPWALLIWPPLAYYFATLARRSLADLSALRRNLAVGIRLLVVTFLVLAIAGIQLVRYNRDLAVMFVVDYSDSVGPAAKAAAEKYIQDAIKNRKPNDKWGVVVFGREAFVDLAPGNAPSLGENPNRAANRIHRYRGGDSFGVGVFARRHEKAFGSFERRQRESGQRAGRSAKRGQFRYCH